MFQKILFKDQLEKLVGNRTTIEFAEQTGMNRTYLSKYLNLRLSRPPSPHILKSIAGKLVSYEELMISCGYLSAMPFSPAKALAIPVIGAIHAGLPMEVIEDIESYEYIDASEVSPAHSYFYLRVEGDSMENARIFSGDLVFIRRQEDVDSGDIAVVIIDEEVATLKRVLKKNSSIILKPENSNYLPMIFPSDQVHRIHIVGKVIHVKFSL